MEFDYKKEAEQIVAAKGMQQPAQNGFTNIFDAVRKGKEEQVKREFLKKTSTDTGRKAREGGPEDNANQATGSLTHREKLLRALEKKDAGKVWNLIAEGKEEDVKTANSLNEHQQTRFQNEDAEQERIKIIPNQYHEGTAGDGERIEADGQETNSSMEEQQQTPFENKDEQEWITIRSDPLYIGLEWLWRTNPYSQTTFISSNSATDGRVKKESNLEDVIEAALRNAHLLEKIALYEHHDSRDKYTRRAEKYEKFAADVVEESTNWTQLQTIMDVEGTGCLVNSKSDDFSQSLSLLKIAADKKRKKVCVIPCHF